MPKISRFAPTLVALFFGILGGLIAGLLMFFALQTSLPAQVTTLVRRERVIEEPEPALLNIQQNLIYIVDKPSAAEYLETDAAKTMGLALTTDGLIASVETLKDLRGKLAVSYDRHAFALTAAKDAQGQPFSAAEFGVTFYRAAALQDKLAPALKPVALASFERFKIGQRVVVVDSAGSFTFQRVVDLYAPETTDTTLASDQPFAALEVDKKISEGAWVFFEDGELAGFGGKDGRVVPAEFLSNVLRQYLKAGQYWPTIFGVHFLDLTKLVALKETLPKEGLLLKNQPRRPAVIAGSVAAKAGLKEGDVLTSFDGRRFDGILPFPLLLQRYQPGAEVEVKYLRAGKEESVKVVLGGQ